MIFVFLPPKYRQDNVLLRYTFGGAVMFFSLQHFISPAFALNALLAFTQLDISVTVCLPSQRRREAVMYLFSFG